MPAKSKQTTGLPKWAQALIPGPITCGNGKDSTSQVKTRASSRGRQGLACFGPWVQSDLISRPPPLLPPPEFQPLWPQRLLAAAGTFPAPGLASPASPRCTYGSFPSSVQVSVRATSEAPSLTTLPRTVAHCLTLAQFSPRRLSQPGTPDP